MYMNTAVVFSGTVMYCYVLLCIIMYGYVLLCIVMYCYVLLCTVMYTYVHLCTLMYTYVHLGTLGKHIFTPPPRSLKRPSPSTFPSPNTLSSTSTWETPGVFFYRMAGRLSGRQAAWLDGLAGWLAG